MNKLFVVFDGDNAGQHVGTAVLKDNVRLLNEISKKIERGNQVVKDWVAANGGTMISSGGDEGSFMIDPSKHEMLNEMKHLYETATGFTVTIGTGLSLSQAGKSLIAGKLSGKNMIMNYDDHVELILRQAHSGAMGNDPEIDKMNEHYLDHVMDEENQSTIKEEENDEIQEDTELPKETDQEPFSENEKISNQKSAEQDPECDCPLCTGIQDEDTFSENEEGLDLQGVNSAGEESTREIPIDLPENPSMKENEEEEKESPNTVAFSKDNEQKPEDQIKAPMAGQMNEEENSDFDPSDDPRSQEYWHIPANEDSEEQKESEYEGTYTDTADVAQSSFEEMPEESNSDNISSKLNDAIQAPEREFAVNQDLSADDSFAENEKQEEPSELDLLSSLLADSQSYDEAKQKIAVILEKFKTHKDMILQLKDTNPELYASIVGLLKQTIDLARQMQGDQSSEGSEALATGGQGFPKA